MTNINLQEKTTAKQGTIECYYFENLNIGIDKTLFHRIHIPLSPFQSGLDNDTQPVDTQIIVEWLDLNLKDATNLDRLNLTSSSEDDRDTSLYIGNVHNPCDLKQLKFKKIGEYTFEVDCILFVDFEYEGVAKNETFKFVTQLELDPNIKDET